MVLKRPIVAFDLDGTLIDSVVDLGQALNAALLEQGLLPFDMPSVRGFVGRGARHLVLQALTERSSPDRVDEALAAFQRHYASGLLGATRPFAGIPEALASLSADATLAVATNKPGAFARALVEALLPGRIAVVLGPDDAGALKPDPKVLHVVGQRLGGPVACFVGDSPIDIETARNAGLPVVAVSWGLSPRAALLGADVVVDSPADLASAVAGLLSVRR